MQKLDEQLQLLRQATPLLRQRARQLADAQAAEVREQLALVLEQQTNYFEASMKVGRIPLAAITGAHPVSSSEQLTSQGSSVSTGAT